MLVEVAADERESRQGELKGARSVTFRPARTAIERGARAPGSGTGPVPPCHWLEAGHRWRACASGNACQRRATGVRSSPVVSGEDPHDSLPMPEEGTEGECSDCQLVSGGETLALMESRRPTTPSNRHKGRRQRFRDAPRCAALVGVGLQATRSPLELPLGGDRFKIASKVLSRDPR
jgi:hypothetical protein